ncbi:MAG: OmpH family outer membrane protein [Polaribacter sp.]
MKNTHIIILILALASCKQETYKVGYVNLNEIYPKLTELVKSDSIYRIQQQEVENYAVSVNNRLKEKRLKEKALQELTKKYNDTLTAFKQRIDKAYTTVLNTENSKIQKAIDSISKLYNYEYVLSTKNSSILFVKDTTNNLTPHILRALGLK